MCEGEGLYKVPIDTHFRCFESKRAGFRASLVPPVAQVEERFQSKRINNYGGRVRQALSAC